MSVVPPGAKPTIKRTGRVGYDCAPAIREIVGSAAAPAARRRNRRRGSFIAVTPSHASSSDHFIGAGEHPPFAYRALRNIESGLPRQSGLMLAARITLPHFSV